MSNIINLLLKISSALESGKSLESAQTWSNVVTASHALVAVFGFLLIIATQCGYNFNISASQIAELAGSIASVGSTIFGVLHVLTNPNAGIKRK